MIDERTLMGRISDEVYQRYFQEKFYEKINNLSDFMKKVSLFENLTNNVFLELSKFIKIKPIIKNE